MSRRFAFFSPFLSVKTKFYCLVTMKITTVWFIIFGVEEGYLYSIFVDHTRMRTSEGLPSEQIVQDIWRKDRRTPMNVLVGKTFHFVTTSVDVLCSQSSSTAVR